MSTINDIRKGLMEIRAKLRNENTFNFNDLLDVLMDMTSHIDFLESKYLEREDEK